MKELQTIKENAVVNIRTFLGAVFTEFQKNLGTTLDSIVNRNSLTREFLGFLPLYASGGAIMWGQWKIHKDTFIFPELKEKAVWVNDKWLTLEELDQQVELLLYELKGLELGLENFGKILESNIEEAIGIFEEKVDAVVKEENPIQGSFAFEEVLMLRDTLGYILQFLKIRLEFDEDLPFELDLSKYQCRIKRCDLELKINFVELAQKYSYIEFNSCFPEDFWWRNQYGFLEGPGAELRRNWNSEPEIFYSI